MIFRTNKYYLLILLVAFIVGGCGNFSGNYEEIKSSASLAFDSPGFGFNLAAIFKILFRLDLFFSITFMPYENKVNLPGLDK